MKQVDRLLAAFRCVAPGSDIPSEPCCCDKYLDLFVPASATSSSNAVACGAAIILREAIDKTGYDWRANGKNLPVAMLAIMQRTGKPVEDEAARLSRSRLDLLAAL